MIVISVKSLATVLYITAFVQSTLAASKTFGISGPRTSEEGKRYFNLTSEIKGDCLYIVSTNNYDKPLKMDGETYSSTKHQGKGIGLHSMKSITEVYDGIFDAGNNNGEFFVDIMLKY